MTKRYLRLILIEFFLIGLLAAFFLSNNYTEDSLRIFIAWAAKLAALFFSLAFMASSLACFIKASWTADLVKYRPHMGLSFMVFHSAHLIFLGLLQFQFHPVFDLAARKALMGGSLAYVFMYMMALTTFPYFKNKLSQKTWNRLHLIGGWWIWLIFFRSYFKAAIGRNEEYLMFAALSLVLFLRLAYLISSRMKGGSSTD